MTTVLAAAGDTWGISGPQFLQIFAILAVAAVLLALIWRRMATRGGDLSTLRQPSPVELAYLNGGESLAVHSSVAGLRCAQAIASGPTTGTLVAVGPMPAGFSDLDYAVHSTLSTPQSVAFARSDPRVNNALRRISDRLVDEGLVLSPGQRAAARMAALPVLGVAALGIARIVAGIANHKSVGFLVFAAIVVFIVGLRLLAVPTTSRAGRALMKRLRSSNAHLRPNQAPSWATYGAAGAMLGVALWGTEALWAADPAFATHAGIARAAAGSGGASYSYEGGSSDSGSGSSCSGGSSCGGGGCGGGGCGG